MAHPLGSVSYTHLNTIVGQVARERGLCFPVAYADNEVSMGIRGLFHPALSGAISNNLSLIHI